MMLLLQYRNAPKSLPSVIPGLFLTAEVPLVENLSPMVQKMLALVLMVALAATTLTSLLTM
jgi:hypothetical protein